MCHLREDEEKEYTSEESDVCDECGGTGVIEHPCMPGYYGDCYTCGAD
jgi:rRNA maturation protein Nop10